MNTSELYDMLVKDVQTFNDWRVKHAEVRIDFEGYDFSEHSLTDAVLVNVNLRNTNFKGANIEYASFCNSDASGANFEGVIAGGAHFGSIETADVHLPKAFYDHLSHAAILKGAIFVGADLELSNFRNCVCEEVSFEGANVESVSW